MRVFLLCFLTAASPLLGGGIRSFVNDEGVRVFTNEPPHRAKPAPEASGIAGSDAAAAYRPLIEDAASRYGVDGRLVEAIMAVESNFNPKAVSKKNCKGLMQLHPDTAKRFGVQDVFDPAENIEGGVRYLQFLIDSFPDDLTHAVAAYNAGENAVKKYAGVPPYDETVDYVRKVGRLFDLSATARAAQSVERRPRRVQRVEMDDGGVLFTNAPGTD